MIPNKEMRKLRFGDATHLTNAQTGFEPTLRVSVLHHSTKN